MGRGRVREQWEPCRWRENNRRTCSGPKVTFWGKLQEKRSSGRGRPTKRFPKPKQARNEFEIRARTPRFDSRQKRKLAYVQTSSSLNGASWPPRPHTQERSLQKPGIFFG